MQLGGHEAALQVGACGWVRSSEPETGVGSPVIGRGTALWCGAAAERQPTVPPFFCLSAFAYDGGTEFANWYYLSPPRILFRELAGVLYLSLTVIEC